MLKFWHVFQFNQIIISFLWCAPTEIPFFFIHFKNIHTFAQRVREFFKDTRKNYNIMGEMFLHTENMQ